MAFSGLVRAFDGGRILLRDERHCAVDKPAGTPCGAGPRAPDTPLGDLRERLFRHGCGELQRWFSPPARASGVALLGFTSAAASVDGQSLPEAVKAITYVVAIDPLRLPSSGRLSSKTGDELSLDYRITARSGTRGLIEIETRATPEQVASLFAAQAQPVVGDVATDAPAATRLMLHVAAISGQVKVSAPLPAEFESWLAGAPVRSAAHFSDVLREAALSRFDLWPTSDAFVLMTEAAGEIAGISVERYGDYAVVYVSNEEAWSVREELADCLMDHGARGVYLKRRIRADLRGADVEALAPKAPLRGEAAPDPLRVRQGPYAFWVQLGDGLATGLFLDQRAAWGRVGDSARGTSFLNLFCYTGAFSVAAAAGGAAQTTSVDLSARALTRLSQNLELNGLSGAQHRLLKSDVPRWLARAGRAGRRFDRIVLDPPSFGSRGRGVLSTERDYASLLRSAVQLLESSGRLTAVSHHRKISQLDLAAMCGHELEAAGSAASVERLVGPWDCPTLPGVSATQSVLATRS